MIGLKLVKKSIKEDEGAHGTNSDQESILNQKKLKSGARKKKMKRSKSFVERVPERVSADEEDEEKVHSQT